MSKIMTITLPDIGEGVVEGEVIEWLKKEGEPVSQDEPVVVVMTDKATVELPSPYAGRFVKGYYQVGELALLDEPLYDIATDQASEELETVEEKKLEPAVQKEKVVSQKPTETGLQASPAVRHLAKQLGVSLCEVSKDHTGPLTAEDVKKHLFKEAALSSTTTLPPLPRYEGSFEEPLVGIRGLMAETMDISNRVIPHFSFFAPLCTESVRQRREEQKERYAEKGIKLTFMPFFIQALSLALKNVPAANASVDLAAKKLLVHSVHNIGIAMNTPQGLVVPVLKGVESMSFEEIVLGFEALKEKARLGKLEPGMMKEATVTLTNFGTLGGLAGTPVIPYPQTAILGMGKIQKEAVVEEDVVVIRERVLLSWSFDHRVLDGAKAALLSSSFVDVLS